MTDSTTDQNVTPEVNLFPQASPCGAAVFYKRDSNGDIEIYLSGRLIEGKGTYGLYGGFANCRPFIDNNPVGYMHDRRLEIYRELKEEVGPELMDFVSEAEFIRDSQYLTSLMVYANDPHGNEIHDALYLSYEVSDELADFLANRAQATEEQMPAKPYAIRFSSLPHNPERILMAPYDGHEYSGQLVMPDGVNLFHKHEAAPIALTIAKFYGYIK